MRNADAPAWSVRAAAGRQLAASDRIAEEDDAGLLHRLLLDTQDTAVIQETAVALLERRDTVGLRHVLRARSRAETDDAADEIGAALDCNPDWMTTAGADLLIEQYRELATDEDVGIRDEARRCLAGLRPREEWARDPEATLD